MSANIEKKIQPMFVWGKYLGSFGVLALALLTVTDVIGRKLFNSPVLGVYEGTGLLLSVIGSCGLAAASGAGDHIAVDVLFEKLSPRGQRTLALFGAFLSFCVFSVLLWRSTISTIEAMTPPYDKVTGSHNIVTYPFRIVLVSALFLSCLAAVNEFLRAMGRKTTSKSNGNSARSS